MAEQIHLSVMISTTRVLGRFHPPSNLRWAELHVVRLLSDGSALSEGGRNFCLCTREDAHWWAQSLHSMPWEILTFNFSNPDKSYSFRTLII